MSATAASTLLGGIGLFLLGMSLMTDSLSALGGTALRRLVRALTRNRYYGVLTGAGITALVQSSSATTLVTVGFVSAGLLTFTDSLGLIFGANIGTTSTAWIVSTLGLKVQVSTVALPVIGVGALVRLTGRGRRARFGLALAGFGLVFVGIDVMQLGMSQLDIDLAPESGSSGFLGIVTLVGVGLLMTVVLQSSSAAVATTLVALHSGAITLEQAAALVIGQNVGTTVTAILGAVGANLAARRAAVAHTMFNIGTGAVALALLSPFLLLVKELGSTLEDGSPETALALFHTAFNVLGVALIFPFTPRFARLVERLVPQRLGPAAPRLSRSALRVPAMALEGARRSTAKVALEAVKLGIESLRSVIQTDDPAPAWQRALSLLSDPRALLAGSDETSRALATRLQDVKAGAEAITAYLGKLRTSSEPPTVRDEHVELLHAVDHLHRLIQNIEREDGFEAVRSSGALQEIALGVVTDLDTLLPSVPEDPVGEGAAEFAEGLRHASSVEHERRDRYRAAVLARVADADLEPPDAELRLKASRWVGKIPKHAHRVFLHLAWTTGGEPPPPEEIDEA